MDWDDGVVAWHPAGDLLTLDVLHNFGCLGNKNVLVEKVARKIFVYCDSKNNSETEKEVAGSEGGNGGEESEESKESNGGEDMEESNGGPESEESNDAYSL